MGYPYPNFYLCAFLGPFASGFVWFPLLDTGRGRPPTPLQPVQAARVSVVMQLVKASFTVVQMLGELITLA